jgi:hypothetical protein
VHSRRILPVDHRLFGNYHMPKGEWPAQDAKINGLSATMFDWCAKEPARFAVACYCMFLVELLLPADAQFSDARRKLAEDLSQRFGGMTAFNRAPAKGLFEQGEKRVEDDIIVFEVMVDEIERVWWKALRTKLENEMQQDEIVIRASHTERL